MYKVDIEYIDYINDDKKTAETYYFNLNAFELAEVGVEFDGDLGEYMRQAFAGDSENYKDGFKVLRMLFIKGYGRRQQSEDGSKFVFVKKPQWIQELLPSPGFEAFYLKLTEDATFATAFWNGLVTPELLKRAKLLEENGDVQAAHVTGAKKFRDLPLEEQVKLLQARNAVLEKTPANEINE